MNTMKIILYLIILLLLISRPSFAQIKQDSITIHDLIHVKVDTIAIPDTIRELIYVKENIIEHIPDSIHVITKSEAIDIAMNYGLEMGLSGWRISLTYCYGDVSDYIWTIDNTLYSNNNGEGGKCLIIFARTGKIKSLGDWTSIYN